MAEEIEARKLRQDRFEQAEIARNQWFVMAEAGTSVEDVLHKDYWSHVANKLQPYDRITVAIETNEWLLDLHVHSAWLNGAQVVILNKYDDIVPKSEVKGVKTVEALKVVWRGRYSKHCVVRAGDDSLVKDKFESPSEAHAFIATYQGQQQAA